MPDAKPSGKPYFVVLNPASGSDQSNRARDTIARVIEAAGQRVEFLEFRDASAIPATARLAAERALAEDGTVVACGGDGTINVVAAAALDAGVPLGVIPQGTFNYFGRAFGTDVEQAVTLMLQFAPRPLAVGSSVDSALITAALDWTAAANRSVPVRRRWRVGSASRTCRRMALSSYPARNVSCTTAGRRLPDRVCRAAPAVAVHAQADRYARHTLSARSRPRTAPPHSGS